MEKREKRKLVVGGDGEKGVDSGLDAIIVGAGVAGSALAYTLVKVLNMLVVVLRDRKQRVAM